MMKRRYVIAAVLLILLFLGAGFLWASSHSLSLSVGVCLKTQDGQCLLIADNSPIVLSASGRSVRFDEFATGDRLLVLHDGVQESYPARTGVYGAWKTCTGSAEDIPQQVIDSLSKLGWLFTGVVPSQAIYRPETLTDCAVSWANYDDSASLYPIGLNADKMYISSVQHLPIFKFETLQELESFKEHRLFWGDPTHGYDEVPSFTAVTEHMDESYFEKYTLLLTYVSAGSCSYRYGIDSIRIQGNSLCMHVRQTTNPEIGDCAMAGWFLTAALEKDALKDIVSFDADLNNLPD